MLRWSVLFLICSISTQLRAQEIREHKTILVDGHEFIFTVEMPEEYICILKIVRDSELILTDSLDYYYSYGEFKDFNKDGHTDWITSWSTNVLWQNLYQYDPKTREYRHVKHFREFNDALPVSGSRGYYYSYRKNGCADANWISDLFVIKDFEAIKLTRINGIGCPAEGNNERLEIRVYQDPDSFAILENLPYDTIQGYQDYKWGFIKAYWEKNIERFK